MLSVVLASALDALGVLLKDSMLPVLDCRAQVYSSRTGVRHLVVQGHVEERLAFISQWH